ncbi:uncharacterized protein TrAtP1_009001 [Trichoderma atroviride]|uniref:uncharacterized protein n=1 Tax=Hypocrea atroviridis TaxID=63577 RepID=UPI003319704F|nr:hypothetical protein TrAtP1_009001 [Trichoderma atroviride]
MRRILELGSGADSMVVSVDWFVSSSAAEVSLEASGFVKSADMLVDKSSSSS